MEKGQDGRLVIVSNRLPVRIERQAGDLVYHPSVGGLATALKGLSLRGEMLWLGWPGIEAATEAEQTEVEARLQRDFGCVPLFIPPEDFEPYYDGFSNRCLWPLFHYFAWMAHYDVEDWRAYERVNRRFCEKAVQIARPGDRFWIHDYHLMRLPAMLREALPEATIGFFLHIPFPSFEILRTLPWRVQVLEGLLGADLIGFHSFSYTRHFLSSLLRLLGLEHEFGQVVVGERPVRVDTFPLGIDTERFAAAHRLPEVQRHLADLRRQTEGRRVVLSVDRLDFTKGIPERLEAFAHFLERHPEWQGRVTLISLCVPSRTRVPEYQQLKRQVDELVGRINGRFGRPGWTPIWYLYRALPFEELVPLYLLADVALVTPLRDGMNLVAKEYLACRSDGTGVLVLSETAGSAEELGEALIVNPLDQEGIVAAMAEALTMPVEEQRRRNRSMLGRLRRYDTRKWAADFLDQLEGVRRDRPRYRQRRLEGDNRKALVRAYRRGKRRLLLLDYDGTLTSLVPRAEDARPDVALLKLVGQLAEEADNTVVIVSGRDHETLEDWLGGVGADLVAEHGARYRLAQDGRWQVELDDLPGDWKDQVRAVLQVYVDRTPGAHLEDKGLSLAWHYRRADPELGWLRAKELVNALEPYVANTPLQILQGNKVVEVKPGAVSKGRAAQRWLRRQPGYDFLLAAGDDVTDEDLFEALPADAWTIKVGRATPSAARFTLPNSQAVRDLLGELIGP